MMNLIVKRDRCHEVEIDLKKSMIVKERERESAVSFQHYMYCKAL